MGQYDVPRAPTADRDAPHSRATENPPAPVAPYSHAVEQDGWLFTTGQRATDPDDDSRAIPDGIEARTQTVTDNPRRVPRGLGSSLEQVVSVRVFLTAFERDYAPFNDIYRTYFASGRLSARTTVGVTALARGGLIEVGMIARRAD
jgi:2-iminobutanoate/2-iminopropanoate deaminase